MKHIVVFILKCYQHGISPFLPSTCRFHPTCSTYTQQAVMRFGAAKGIWIGLKRLSKCHPWYKGNTLIDNIPDKDEN